MGQFGGTDWVSIYFPVTRITSDTKLPQSTLFKKCMELFFMKNRVYFQYLRIMVRTNIHMYMHIQNYPLIAQLSCK